MGVMNTIKLKILTPCFCAGADQAKPEIRVSSIRGQLRWWFRKLYNNPEMEKRVFGRIGKEGEGQSSKVVLRVNTNPQGIPQKMEKILPHKPDGLGQRNAISKDYLFDLHYSFRHFPTNEEKQAFERILEVWSLLGSLGARGNRAAGSIFVEQSFATLEEFKKRITGLNLPDSWCIRVSDRADTPDKLRVIASDTVNDDDFLGFANGRERKASPFKIKVVSIENRNHLLIFAESEDVIEGALNVLKNAHNPKELGLLEWDIIK